LASIELTNCIVGGCRCEADPDPGAAPVVSGREQVKAKMNERTAFAPVRTGVMIG